MRDKAYEPECSCKREVYYKMYLDNITLGPIYHNNVCQR